MKKIVRGLIFVMICIALFHASNKILVEKGSNRYYMLREELKDSQGHEVLVFGSCHAYTSFNPVQFKNEYGITAYNMGNSSEIMPATYLRLLEQLKKNQPKVVLVETWGINPYETYIETEKIMNLYLPPNIENIPFSKEKLEVIADFDELDFLEDNFATFKYKERLTEMSLTEIDFRYSFERATKLYEDESGWMYEEMENRFAHNGFLAKESEHVEEYEQRQNHVSKEDLLEIEADILKYIDKIIQLCEEYDVKLIFYRAPYISSENELRKLNYLEQYLEERNVDFYDLEKEIEFSYFEDFSDYEHLSEIGAQKTTKYLGDIIYRKMNEE